jgi:hypothetical protein
VRSRSLALVLFGVALVFLPGSWMSPTRFSAWAAGVQAAGLIAGFAVAGLVFGLERKERAVERALSLHTEYETGPMAQPRGRLVTHLRSQSGIGVPAHAACARGSTYGSAVLGGDLSLPAGDLSSLLNYFDRILRSLERGLVDETTVKATMSHHVLWWEEQLAGVGGSARHSLSKLAIRIS